MNGIDIVVIIILSIFLIRGLFRGILIEVLSLVGMILAYIIALREMSTIANLIAKYISLPDFVLSLFSFTILFILVLLVTRLLAKTLSKLVKETLVGWLDRLGGGVFGLAKGVIVTSLVLLLLSLIPLPEAIKTEQQKSTLDKSIRPVTPAIFNWIIKVFPQSKDFYEEVKEGFSKQTKEMKEKVLQDKLDTLKDDLNIPMNLDSLKKTLSNEELEKIQKEYIRQTQK